MRIISNDNDALSQFQRQYQPRFEHIARCARISDVDCEDVARIAVTSAIRQIQERQFRGDSRLATWLHYIIRSKIADHKRSPRFAVMQDHPRPVEPEILPPASAVDPTTRLMVRQTLNRMVPQERTLLMLKDLYGFSSQEIGARLSLSEAQVNQALSRARKNFRQLFKAPRELGPGSRLSIEGDHD